MAIWLVRLALDRWRQAEPCPEPGRSGCDAGEGADAAPVVLIAETQHGPRLTAANAAAAATGARPGMALADARALSAELRAEPADPDGDAAFLARLALWAQRWGPHTALDPPDGLLVDVSALDHLFGGEPALLAEVESRLAAQGLAARAAIAPTAGAAWALAHYGAGRAIMPPLLSLSKGGEDLLAQLPVAALRLDAATVLVLRRLGLKRIGDLAGIGRDALKRRFRRDRAAHADPLARLDQLLGRRAEPLLPVVARPDATAERRLMEPIRHRELLERVVADLAEDLAQALEARGEGARRLELTLWRVDGGVMVRHLEFAAATRAAAHVARLLGARLDGLDAGFGIELVRLTARWAEPLAVLQAGLERGVERPGTTLATCLDRLTVRLGPDAVRRPVGHASHIPERAQRWQPPLAPPPPAQEELRFHARPLKLLDRPEPIDVLRLSPEGHPLRFRWRGGEHAVARVEGPERIAPEWWRESGKTRLRDYYRIEDERGRRYWLYRRGLAGDGRGGLPDWFMQGLCG